MLSQTRQNPSLTNSENLATSYPTHTHDMSKGSTSYPVRQVRHVILPYTSLLSRQAQPHSTAQLCISRSSKEKAKTHEQKGKQRYIMSNSMTCHFLWDTALPNGSSLDHLFHQQESVSCNRLISIVARKKESIPSHTTPHQRMHPHSTTHDETMTNNTSSCKQQVLAL